MSDSIADPAPGGSASRIRPGGLAAWAAGIFLVSMLLWMGKVPGALHWPVRLLFAASAGWLAFAAFRAVRRAKPDAKSLVFSLVMLAMMYGAFHLISLVFVKLMSAKDERLTTASATSLTERARRGVEALLAGDSPVIYDQEIGWVQRPGYSWKGHNISEQGLRGTRIYPEAPADPGKRILCIGDSFTFGYEVPDEEAFPYHGEQLAPGTEWINLGNCGSGLTQGLLQYRRAGRQFGGQHVVIAFMTNNNKRTVNCFRPFVSPDDAMTPLTQPYAKISGGEFSLEPNPYQDISDYEKLLASEREEVERLHRMDYLTWSNQQGAANPVARTLGYLWESRDMGRNLDLLLARKVDAPAGKLRRGGDPYGSALWHPRSLGFQANARVFEIYHDEVVADGREPLIVILPSAQDVEDRAKGHPPKHAWLLKHLADKGYRHFDFLDSLEARHGGGLKKENLFVRTHFNGEANKFLAEEIIQALSLN